VAQKGKCAVTGQELILNDMHCHHKRLWFETKDDSYKNLMLITKDVHQLIHAKSTSQLSKLMRILSITEKQRIKIDELRALVGNFSIYTKEQNTIDLNK
jgi:hypothetical protein